MSEGTVWLLIVGMGVITYALRLSMIALLGRIELPPLLLRALRYIPPAVFSALVAPALVRPEGPMVLSLGNPYLLAGALAAVTSWRTRSMLLTIVAAMAALWLLR